MSNVGFQAIRSALPIATRAFSFYEWLLIASATRMLTGLMRITVNRPSQQRRPPLNKEQRWQSFLERCFMEGIGVPLHVLSVYIFQEPVSKLFERLPFLKAPSAEKLAIQGVSNPAELAKWQESITKAIKQTYHPTNCTYAKDIVANQIYHRELNVVKVGDAKRLAGKLFDGRTLEHMPEGVIKGMDGLLMKFNKRLWIASAVTLGAGVLASAILTGSVMQSLNDNFISKKVVPKLMTWFGITPKSLPTPQEALPTPFQSPQPFPPTFQSLNYALPPPTSPPSYGVPYYNRAPHLPYGPYPPTWGTFR